MKFILGFVAAILLIIAGSVALIYSGAYNVAADEDHTRIAKWILGTAMTNSVKAHADASVPPAGFDDEEHLRSLPVGFQGARPDFIDVHSLAVQLQKRELAT